MLSFVPMQPHNGAVSIDAAPELVIGRDKNVKQLWNVLESGSVRLLSERRMGKTWLLTLAMARTPEWAAPIRLDVQNLSTPYQLAEGLCIEFQRSGLVPAGFWKSTGVKFRRALHRFQRGKVRDIEVPEFERWQDFLEKQIAAVVEHQDGKRPVIILDEFPFLLDKMMKEGNAGDATALLDELRKIRHSYPSVRMVLCGSLGLHIVLDRLAAEKYTGRPVNDMPPFEVTPLEVVDAVQLAGNLIVGTKLPCADTASLAAAVAEAASCVPFYIQRLITWMQGLDEPEWAPYAVRGELRQRFLTATGNPGEFPYYDDRLGLYYDEDLAERARAVLDVVSRYPKGCSPQQLLNEIHHRPKMHVVDHETLLPVLRTLRDDHYLVEDDAGWRFKLDIVRQWWFQERGGLGL